MNACAAIVKERAIYSRERMIGLALWAYLLSKPQLMTLESFIQAFLVLVVTAHTCSSTADMYGTRFSSRL